MPASLFVTTRFVYSPHEEEKEEEFKEEMVEELDDDDSIFVHEEDRPGDIIMVRSKVAPVLLPVNKGLMMPSHHMQKVTPPPSKMAMGIIPTLPPPGLPPPPTQTPLPFQTYLEVTLPQHYPFHSGDMYTKNMIASNALIFLVEYIWTHDPTAMIAKFPNQLNDSIAAPPIEPDGGTRNREFPNTVKMVSYYLHNCRFHASGAAGRVKIFLMHTVKLDTLMKDLNTKGSYQFTKCPIQAADIASTAWLLGTTEHTNCKDLTTALLNTPEFKARPEVGLLLRQKWIKLSPNERPNTDNPQQQQVFAVHVYTAKQHYFFVLETLKKLYNSVETRRRLQCTGLPLQGQQQLPNYGQYYAIPDATSYMTMSGTPGGYLDQTLRDQLFQQRRHQKSVRRQCTWLSLDLVGLVPYDGSPILRGGQLLAPALTMDDVSNLLKVDRHPQRAFTYTFSWHQRYTPKAMAAIDHILARLNLAKAAKEKDDGGETKEEETDVGSVEGSSSSHSNDKYKDNDTEEQLIPSTVLWHKTVNNDNHNNKDTAAISDHD